MIAILAISAILAVLTISAVLAIGPIGPIVAGEPLRPGGSNDVPIESSLLSPALFIRTDDPQLARLTDTPVNEVRIPSVRTHDGCHQSTGYEQD